MATGSEVFCTLEAARALAEEGHRVRVVSFPSWELFDAQLPSYREEVLPPRCRARIAVEAGRSIGWERYVGDGGLAIGLDRFGASAPWKVIAEKVGLTAGQIADRARQYVVEQKGGLSGSGVANNPVSDTAHVDHE